MFGHLGLLVGHITLVSKDRICNTLQVGIGNLAKAQLLERRRQTDALTKLEHLFKLGRTLQTKLDHQTKRHGLAVHSLALGQNRQAVGDGMRQRQATALKANARKQNIALDQALNRRRYTALFEIALGSDAALHERVIAGTGRNQGQVSRRATVLVSAVRRGTRTRLEVRCQCVAHTSDRHPQWCCRNHVGINHDQIGIFVEYQVAVERPILVIQHRNRAARTIHRSRRWAYA